MEAVHEKEDALLSISIVSYKIEQVEFTSVLASLNTAIENLVRQSQVRIIIQIIDNGNQAELLQNIISLVQTPSTQYELISNKANIGFGRAHNQSIFSNTAKYHLILNPDVLLAEDCLTEGINYLKANKGTSAVTPRAVDRKLDTQYLCKQYPSLFLLLLRGFAPPMFKKHFAKSLANYEMREQMTGEVVTDIPLISGCFMLCDGGNLKAVGGFDKKYFLYFEDFALSMELSRLGSLSYLPTMQIQHFGGNSSGKGIKHIYMFMRSAIKFFNTYGWKLF